MDLILASITGLIALGSFSAIAMMSAKENAKTDFEKEKFLYTPNVYIERGSPALKSRCGYCGSRLSISNNCTKCGAPND